MQERLSVVELDPELTQSLSPQAAASARHAAVTRVVTLGAGPWIPETDAHLPVGGFLVQQGCITRDVSLLGRHLCDRLLRPRTRASQLARKLHALPGRARARVTSAFCRSSMGP